MAALGDRALSLLALVLVGCSGASNQDLFGAASGQNEENDTSATQPAPSSSPKPSATTEPQPAPVAPTQDAGADAAPEAAKCTPPIEPNDSIGNATPFTSSFCGKIDGPGDIDFAKFVVPAGATGLAITHDEKGGKVAYRYYLNGVLLPVQGDGIPAIAGVTYTVQIKLAANSNVGDRPTYQLNVFFAGK